MAPFSTQKHEPSHGPALQLTYNLN